LSFADSPTCTEPWYQPPEHGDPLHVADVIGASGFDNEIVYLSGDPQIDNTGSNTVTRG